MSDELPVLRLVLQREADDCAIAALATIAGTSYEDALRAVIQIDPKYQGKRGLWIRQLEQAASVLGMPLKRRRKYDLDEDTGLLSIKLRYTDGDHIALLANGLICETNGCLWEPSVYLSCRHATVGILLVPAHAL
jgi:hypothetical protein